MNDAVATVTAVLTNSIGLHARPSVKLTKLAKTFSSEIELAAAAEGPWVDAKSIVKVMAVKAGRGTTLHFRAKGPDADAATNALRDLVVLGFDENAVGETEHG
jgi:phosphocarrier protein